MISYTSVDFRDASSVAASRLPSSEMSLTRAFNMLKATTAGIATSNPTAVAMRASAIPPITAPLASAILLDRSLNARMMPSTVPKSPMKGALLATVAKKPRRFS